MVGTASKGKAAMSAGKREILARIAGPGSVARTRASVPPEAEYGAIVRAYEQHGGLDAESRLALFAERLEDYDAGVHRCREEDIAATIAEALRQRGNGTILIAGNVPAAWRPAGFRFVEDQSLSYGEIDGSKGVLTTCAVAIAMTGTIVLRHSSEEGRRALTLIPDYHICVVRESQVVETVAEGIRLMRGFHRLPITTISGPSATSDIEMTRIKGVHGPRVLDVILATG
jgi:L-lactate dehydrogenase complex protein LldG